MNILCVSNHGYGTVAASWFGTRLQSSQSALFQGDGLSRVLALFWSTLTGEIFAFDVPEAIAVVKTKTQGKVSQECVVSEIFLHVQTYINFV